MSNTTVVGEERVSELAQTEVTLNPYTIVLAHSGRTIRRVHAPSVEDAVQAITSIGYHLDQVMGVIEGWD